MLFVFTKKNKNDFPVIPTKNEKGRMFAIYLIKSLCYNIKKRKEEKLWKII